MPPTNPTEAQGSVAPQAPANQPVYSAPSPSPFSPQPETTPPVSTVVPPINHPAVSSQAQSASNNPPTKNNSGLVKKIAIILGVLIALGAIGLAVAYFVLPRFQKTKEVNLTWWGLWEEESIVKPLIDEYQVNNPNVKITYVKNSQQDYRERLTNALARGTGPDIYRFHNSWAPMFKNDLDGLPATIMSAQEFSDTFYPTAVSDLTVGANIVGIPLEYDALTLFINEDLFNTGGYVPPETWDDVRVLGKALTKKSAEGVITQSGVALGSVANVDHWQEIVALLMLQNGGSLSKPAGDVAKDALVYFNLFSTVDGVWDATLPNSTASFAGGKLAMYFAPSWRVFEIKAKNPKLKFRAVKVPQPPKDNTNQPDIFYATYWAEGVSARSKNKLEAWKFLKFISQKESLEKMYLEASKTREFGEPYPRKDMAGLLSTSPYLSTLIAEAPNAKSWFLADKTFDGPTGINSQVGKYYEDAVNALAGKNVGNATETLATLQNGIKQVLAQYGLAK